MKKVIILSSFLFVVPAMAVDGVVEISSICATMNGCFAGDSSGYPVTITAPGSYRLTTGLTQVSTSTNLIVISANDVSLDLNGFTLSGPANCTGIPVSSCTGSGSGDGIRVIGADNVRIYNGTISNMADDGIFADNISDNPWLDSLTITGNANDGIQWDTGNGQITNSAIYRNRNNGLSLGAGSMRASDIVARGNGNWGQFGGYCSNSLYTSNFQAAEANCIVINTSICGSGSC